MITMAFAIKEPVNCIPAERKLGIKKNTDPACLLLMHIWT